MSEPGDATDIELVHAARAGDAASLGRLLDRHRALLHAVAAGMLGHGPQAEDAVHDTFLIALSRIGDLRDPAAVRSWLMAILGNRCRAQLRRRPVELVADPNDLPPVTHVQPVEDTVERIAMRDWVWAALGRLAEPLRLVVVLRYFTGVSSYAAIADLCGVPVGTVRSRLHAARTRLATELLETAAAAHPDSDLQQRRAMETGLAMAAFEHTGDARELHGALAPDLSFRLADRTDQHGRDLFASLLAADFDDGVSTRPIRVLGGAELSVFEVWLDSPPDQPPHCPPALTQVHIHHGAVTRQILSHYAQPPPLAAVGPGIGRWPAHPTTAT